MTVSHAETIGSYPRVGVSWLEGVVRLRDDDLFGKGLGDQCVCFLRHVFTLAEVAWVEVDRNLSTVSIHYDSGRFALAEFLQRLAAALRRPVASRADAVSMCLRRDLEHFTGRVKIQRFGTTITTWNIVHDRPGRIRLRHQTIYRDEVLASRLRSRPARMCAGVIECAVWPITGSVLIRFDPELTSTADLLKELDRARSTSACTGADVSWFEVNRFRASQLFVWHWQLLAKWQLRSCYQRLPSSW